MISRIYLRVAAVMCATLVTFRVVKVINQFVGNADEFPRKQFHPARHTLTGPNQSESIVMYQPSEPCLVTTRTAGRDPLDGRWYNFSSRNFLLYAYSAFVDDRPSLLSQPVIRILTASNKYETVVKKNVSVTLFCRLYYEAEDVQIVPMVREHRRFGVSEMLSNEDMISSIYTCALDQSNSGYPIAVSVLRSQHEDISSHQQVQSCMPIEIPVKPNTVRDFAICVPVLYGRLERDRLIEWLEMQKLLGISFVGVHSYYLKQPALGVLLKYASEGFVEIRYSDFLFRPVTAYPQRILHSTLAVNDCMYRHMYSFKYIAIIDVDEVILPEHHMTLQDLMTFLRSTIAEKFVTYEFRNNFFFLNAVQNDTSANGRSYNITFFKHRLKAKFSNEPRVAAKSIVNPQACIIMHHHWCWGATADFDLQPLHLKVDPSVAKNRHYRLCNWGPKYCEEPMRGMTNDDGMLRFVDALEERVRKRMTTSFSDL